MSADLDLSQFEGMTPGPWIARNSNIGPIITNADNDGLATVGKWAARDAENAANHRAIAAVPSLIAEVKRQAEQIAELERDRERLNWLIKQGPPGAAEGIGLNEDAWEIATGFVDDDKDNADNRCIRAAIDSATAKGEQG